MATTTTDVGARRVLQRGPFITGARKRGVNGNVILISTTTTGYKLAGDRGYWSSWFDNAEAVKASVSDEVLFYAALEVDGRGLEPFGSFIDRMNEIGGVVETWSYDDGSTVRTTSNRLVRIATGQNFGTHYAMERRHCSHVLFVATDTIMPDDTLPRLMEMDWPICGLNISTYCQDGQTAQTVYDGSNFERPEAVFEHPEWDVRVHMQSAALLLVARPLFLRLRWRIDGDAGMTDDPCYHFDARALGWETLVRHDVQATHYPECLGSMESRHSEADRAYVRATVVD